LKRHNVDENDGVEDEEDELRSRQTKIDLMTD